MAFGMQKLQSDICEQSKQLRATIDTKSSNHAHFTKFCAKSLYIKNSVYKTHTHTHTHKIILFLHKLLNTISLHSAMPNGSPQTEYSVNKISMPCQKTVKNSIPLELWARFGQELDSNK